MQKVSVSKRVLKNQLLHGSREIEFCRITMGRTPCCSKLGLHRGPWTAKEDSLLTDYIRIHGEGNWRNLPKEAGLLRCGKSCRLRWMNYLRPDIKRGNIGPEEEDLIIRLHSLLGNRWSLIAGRLPGRTDNEIKNYWNTHLSKKLKSMGVNIRDGASRAVPRRASSSKKSKSKEKEIKNKKFIKDGGSDYQVQDGAIVTTKTVEIIHCPKPTRLRSMLFRTDEEFSPLISNLGSETSNNLEYDDIDSNFKDFNFIDWGSDGLLQSIYNEYSMLSNSDIESFELDQSSSLFVC